MPTDTAAQDPLEWPASPWDCASPESYLLLHFAKPQASQPLKLGLLELVTRGRLRLADARVKRLFGRSSKVSVFTRGDRAVAPIPDTLAPLDLVFTTHRPAEFEAWDDPQRRIPGAEVATLARQIVAHFGGSLSGYVERVVRPALVARGWLEHQRYRVLGIFPARRWVLTSAGLAAQSDLLWRVEYGNRQLQHLVHDDPQRALAFLGLAGASLLLMSDALPHVRHLREELEAARRAGADYSTTSTGAADSTAAGSLDTPAGLSPAASSNLALDGLSGLDTLGGLDSLDALDTLAGLDLSTLDSLDAAMSAVDSGVDSGAGGDGSSAGDGGGGDSGT